MHIDVYTYEYTYALYIYTDTYICCDVRIHYDWNGRQA